MPDAAASFGNLGRRRPALVSALLLLPVLTLLLVFFAAPLVQLIDLSTLSQQPSVQNPKPPHSLANYLKIFSDPFYLQIAIGLLIILAVYFDHLQGRSINFLRRAA